MAILGSASPPSRSTSPPASPPTARCPMGCPPISPARAASSSSLPRPVSRSEEHTSELQSRQYLVCRLLLEKKLPCLPRCKCYRRSSPPASAPSRRRPSCRRQPSRHCPTQTSSPPHWTGVPACRGQILRAHV